MSQYYQPLEVEIVLYTLWEKRKEIQPTKLHVKQITDSVLSEKRACAIARYAVRVIAPEALDGIGLTDEAQTLRDLPPNVGLKRARAAARAVSVDAARAASDAYAAGTSSAANAVGAAYAAGYSAFTSYTGAAYAAYNAAASVANAANQPNRLVYHLEKMIQVCLNIK